MCGLVLVLVFSFGAKKLDWTGLSSTNQRSFKMHTDYGFEKPFPSSHPRKTYLFLTAILLLRLLVILMSDMASVRRSSLQD
jgi:hypothetical protein